MSTKIFIRRAMRTAAPFLCALGFAACGLESQEAPPLAGPSEFATSIVLRADKDTLVQNGEDSTTIRITVRDEANQPRPGVQLQLTGSSSNPLASSFSLSETTVVTDASGQATTTLFAPPAPASLFAVDPVITISATPVGSDFANSIPRNVSVRLIAPPGTLPANTDPVPSFTIVPAVANIGQSVAFDASATTDDGVSCGSRCDYQWDFGDFTTGSGQTTNHTFTLPGSFTITLTVRDDRGAVASTQRTLTVSGPAAPVANFSVTPANPVRGVAATFNATSSTVGAGATITQYLWDFGDGGATVTSTVPAVQKTYGTAGTFIVTLTITDSLGRQASRTSTVTVNNP